MKIKEVEEAADLLEERDTISRMIELSGKPSSFSIRFERHISDDDEQARLREYLATKNPELIPDVDEIDVEGLDDLDDYSETHPTLFIEGNISEFLQVRLREIEARLVALGVDIG